MDVETGFATNSLASKPGGAAGDALAVAVDRIEMEAAEILAALAHSKKRDSVNVSVEFAAKWGCKGKRVRRRGSGSESPTSDNGLNRVDPVQSGSDLAEDHVTVDQQQVQVTSRTMDVESLEPEQTAESLNSHTYVARYLSNVAVKSRQCVTEEACTLHRTLTTNESDHQMIRESPIMFSIMGMPDKDIWEDRQQDQKTDGNVLIKSVKAEQNDESVSPTCATKYMPCSGGRSRQNLTEAEKEARRLRRILANRESARQTIRRRQALCEMLTLKVADLTRENENLRRAKELALKEYQSQESTNKHLKAQMAKAVKAEEEETPAEFGIARQISGPSRNYPFFFYNQHPLPPFCWPSVVQPSHPFQSQCGHQNATVVPSSTSTPTNGRLDSSDDRENPINVNGPKTPLYVVPYPWLFSLPDHGNGLHPQPSCGPKIIEDETSVNSRSSAGCSLKSVVLEEKCNVSLPLEAEKEAYSSTAGSVNNLGSISVRLPPDGGGQHLRYPIKEEVLGPTPTPSAGVTFVDQENILDNVVKTETTPVRAGHFVGALPEENQESRNYTSKKVLDAAAAAEARKRRKQLTKLKNLHGRQCRVHH